MAVPTQKRQANMEALRIAAMFMVVILHYLSDSGALPESGRGLDGISAFAVTLESLCIVAVNAYVLLSGYFLSMTAFRWRRLLRLLLQVLFYTLLIPPALAVLGLIPASELTDVYHIWNSVFPVQSGQYWFVTAYVILFLFFPSAQRCAGKAGTAPAGRRNPGIAGFLLLREVRQRPAVFHGSLWV